ncbi:hypothetical protein PsorP6_014595 [Peronosclerospora sorghi]|uniref:Uncharacterized protein n=1 Tax=Peronosclerospora sorghi TaxID=230839 RepID=A0ACC0VUC5_9STRA|nr:hypothetical protein PsorP6_014595 [Peronosclerospora sorghi]
MKPVASHVQTTVTSNGTSTFGLQWLKLTHIVLLLKFVLLLIVHELLRPFCLSFRGVCSLSIHVSAAAATSIVLFLKRGFHPKYPEWTFAYEWFQAIASTTGQRHGSHILQLPNAVTFRRNFEFIGWLAGAWACWLYDMELERFRYHGLEHLWLRSRSRTAKSKERIVVLYYHGGGYALFSPRFYVAFACRLLSQIQTQLCVPTDDFASLEVHILLANYRKLPEVGFPTPVDDAMAMYEYVMQDQKVSSEKIIFAGDSAGAGLVLAILLRLRRAKRAMPLAALCSCPYADLSAQVAVARNCFISKSMVDGIRELCLQTTPPSSWREGAMLDANFRELPPLFIQTAEFDILHHQALQLEKKAQADGVTVELDVHAHMPHVFTLFPHFMLPQSQVGIERCAAFITQQVTASHRIPVQLPMAAPAF